MPDPHMLAHLVLSSIIVSGLLMLCGIAINALASLWTRRTRIKPWGTPVVKVQGDQRLVVGPRSDSSGLSPQPKQGSRLWCSIFMLSEAWASLQARAFGRLGYHVARRPWCTLAAVFIFAMGMACGLLVMKKHKDALTMWLPSNAVATHHAAVYSALTKRPRPRSLLVLIESHAVTASTASSSTSPLKALLLEAMEIHYLVTSSGLSNVSAASALSESGFFSPLMLWGYSAATLEADSDPAATLRANLDSIGIDGGVSAGSLRSMVRFSSSLDNNAEPTAIEALLLAYTIDGRLEDGVVGRAIDFERKVRKSMAASAWEHVARVHVFSASALSDDLYAAVGDDSIMIGASIAMMCVYVGFFIRRSDGGKLRYSPALAGFAVFSVLLATLAAFGAGAALGVEYNDNCNMAIFIILGVGVDDAFVIVGALDDIPAAEAAPDAAAAESKGNSRSRSTTTTSHAQPPTAEQTADRIGKALANCGSAILLSSTTNAISFALGANSPLPALQGFCTYAALGMVFDLLFQLTFFVAAVALNERYQCSRLRIPCSFVSRIGFGSSCATAAQSCNSKRSRFRFRAIAACILCTYATTLGLSLNASWYLGVGFRPQELVASSSSIAGFFRAQERLFPRSPTRVELVVVHARRDSSPVLDDWVPMPITEEGTYATLDRFHGALHAMRGVPRVAGQQAISPLWTTTFAQRLRQGSLPSPAQLGSLQLQSELATFLATPDARTLEGVGSLVADKTVVFGTIWQVLIDDYSAEQMVQLRSMLHETGVERSAFAFSALDIYCEQDAGLLVFARDNLLQVIGAVLGTALLLTLSPGFVCLMAACTLSCVAHMIGWMLLTGIQLSSISLVPLLISVGLCIDYMTHIAHAFLEARGTPEERTRTALGSRGFAVLNSGVSTGLSVVLLALGESAIFTTFFWMLLGVVVIGLFHALLVLPLCLCLLPAWDQDQHGECKATSVASVVDGNLVVETPTFNRACGSDFEMSAMHNYETSGTVFSSSSSI
jgi:hypothetical protein